MQKAHAAEQRPRRSLSDEPAAAGDAKSADEPTRAKRATQSADEVVTITMARKDWFIIRDIVLALKSLANVFFEPIHTHDAGYILDPLVSQLLEIFNSWEGAPE